MLIFVIFKIVIHTLVLCNIATDGCCGPSMSLKHSTAHLVYDVGNVALRRLQQSFVTYWSRGNMTAIW